MLFDDTRIAFQSKTNLELRRAQLLFRLVAQQSLVRFGKWITQIFLKLRLPVSVLYRWSVYEQFCGGETVDVSQKVVDTLAKQGVSSIYTIQLKGLPKNHFTTLVFKRRLKPWRMLLKIKKFLLRFLNPRPMGIQKYLKKFPRVKT